MPPLCVLLTRYPGRRSSREEDSRRDSHSTGSRRPSGRHRHNLRSTQAGEDTPTQTGQNSPGPKALALGDDEDAAPAPGQLAGEGDEETKPFIGIAIDTLPAAEATELGIDGGAVVRRVLDDGPSAGILHVGDVITAIDGHAVTSAADVVEIVHASEPGNVLAISVLRDGVPHEVTVTVGTRPVQVRKYLSGLHDLIGAF